MKVRPLGIRKEITDKRPAQTAPDPRTILVHRCFSQRDGESKAVTCVCKERLQFREAFALVAEKKADWLLVKNPKAKVLVAFQRAIVILARATAVRDFQSQRKEGQRFPKFAEIEARILTQFRNFLTQQARAGRLPEDCSTAPLDTLKAVLRNPEIWVERYPEFLAREAGQKKCSAPPQIFSRLCSFSEKWWENVLAFHKLDSESQGTFVPNEEVGGYSPIHYAGTSIDLELISKHGKSSNPDLNDDENAEGHYEYLESQSDDIPEQEL